MFSELNYIPAYDIVSPPDKEKDALADDPVVIAEYEGFKIIYLRLNSSKLLLTKERPIINHLLNSYQTSLFLVSNENQNLWHFVNVKWDNEIKNRRIFRRITVDPQQPYMRTAVERISMLDIAEIQRKVRFPDKHIIQQKHDEAFDVEKVTKEFFKEYKKVFYEIKDKIRGVSESELHLFTQSLFNRLLFLKFLEKKGWLDNDYDYLNRLVKKAVNEDANFYKHYLYYLFFYALNNQFDNSELGNKQAIENRLGKIPYLNGGLFEFSENWKDCDAEIDNDIFKIIFKFLNRYNFTVTESTPLDPSSILVFSSSLINRHL